MEKILTDYQVEWLANLKLLSDYEDNYYEKDEMPEKTGNFIENNYSGEEENIMEEFEVLKQKEFINFNTSVNQFGSIVIDDIGLTKAGSDYLTMLEEEFKKSVDYNEIILKIQQELCNINKKSSVDKTEQIITIISSLGSITQLAIPTIVRMLNS